MASAGSIRYARAEVEIGANLGPLQQGLNKARAELQSWGAGLMGIGSRMVGFGLAMAAPFALAVKAASDSEETLNKFRAVFGAQAETAEAFAKNLASSIGRGETEIRDGMSAMMAMFVGLGFGGEQARKMAEEVTALSYDFGSFFNIADDEAMQRFLSAFAGSSQVLDQFGMNIKADAMDLEFLRMGIAKTTATATEQEKTLARLNIIRRTMGSQGAIGDALKTADGFANTWKRVKAQVWDAAIAIGSAVLPVVTKIASAVANAVKAFAAWVRQNQGVVIVSAIVITAILGIGGALVGLGGTLFAVGVLFKAMAAAVAFLGAVCAFVFSPIGIALLAIAAAVTVLTYLFPELALAIMEIAGNIFAPWVDALHEVGAVFARVWRTISAALVAGEFKLAFQAAMLGLELIWTKTINWLRDGWFSFTMLMGTLWDQACASIQHAMVDMASFIGEAFWSMLGLIAEAINMMIRSIPAFIRNRVGITEVIDPGTAEARAGRAEETAAAHRAIEQATARSISARGAPLTEERARARAEESELQRQMNDIDWAIAESGGIPSPTTTAPRAIPGAEALAAVSDSMGTFSAAAASGMGIGAAERTARATEEMVQLLRAQNGLIDAEDEDMDFRYT